MPATLDSCSPRLKGARGIAMANQGGMWMPTNASGVPERARGLRQSLEEPVECCHPYAEVAESLMTASGSSPVTAWP